jgi:CubicO group peptidase (beta-lactamase class C family)
VAVRAPGAPPAPQTALSELVEAAAEDFGMPGVAAGVWIDGHEMYACDGVTSLENPLQIDRETLFLVGSVTQTFTATALMCLVASGQVSLEAPVARYLPDLRLADAPAAPPVSVRNLLNHTSGLDWGLIADTGEGDDALAMHVARMAELDRIAAPGSRASYSQGGYNLAGRIIEAVTGLAYEQAVASLVLEPVGLAHTLFARDDIMTRRFCVGHNLGRDGWLSVARLWRRSRGDNPGAGLASSVADQLRWARFHLGDGRAEDGTRVLPAELMTRMRAPTAPLRASTRGDAVGVGWFLRDVEGVRTAGHIGTANGQFAEILIAPGHCFGVVALSNAGPDGISFNREVVRWALDTYLGVTWHEPEPVSYDPACACEVLGSYESDVVTLTISADGDRLRLSAVMKPEIRATADAELPPDHPPFDLGLLPGDADEYVITGGALNGQRGFFTRAADGSVTGVDLGGRLYRRA